MSSGPVLIGCSEDDKATPSGAGASVTETTRFLSFVIAHMRAARANPNDNTAIVYRPGSTLFVGESGPGAPTTSQVMVPPNSDITITGGGTPTLTDAARKAGIELV